jgi:transposase InsO family protein
VGAILHLRRLRMTAAEIAEVLRMALSAVSLILKRLGLGKRSRLAPLEPVNRYECERPGELVHLDIKPLARFDRPGHKLLGRGRGRFETGAGYEYVYVAVDDYSRVAHAALLPDERAATAARFLRTTSARFRVHGVTIERVLTDNGSAFRAGSFRDACAQLAIKHSRTRPRRPQTNGKAERFIQTLLREGAHARLYATSDERAQIAPALAQPLQLPPTTRQPQPPAARDTTEQRV